MAISVRERVASLPSSRPSVFGRAVLFFVLAESIIIAFVGAFSLTLAYLLILLSA